MIITTAAVVKTNSELIADYVQPLYLNDDQITMDVTWGRGKWWTKWQPKQLIKHDLYTVDGVDFRNLPEDDNSVDVIAFDPPYVATGGRKTSTEKDFQNRFGMDRSGTSPAEVRQLICDGMREAQRVVVPKGLVLVKCSNYVHWGAHVPGVHWTLTDAIDMGYTVVTQFVHVSGVGPQPTHTPAGKLRVIRSPRSNFSQLIILRK